MASEPMSDRERWDAKHAAAPPGPEAPDPFVLRALALVPLRPGARALDLAAGRGRHALELARRGYETHAWDVSPAGLAILASRAEEARLDIATRVLDVTGDLPPDAFDLVVVVSFLDRPLHARLAELVRPGGHLVLTTFTTDREGSVPSARHCLAQGELARGLPGLETLLAVEEGGRAGILARRLPRA